MTKTVSFLALKIEAFVESGNAQKAKFFGTTKSKRFCLKADDS